MPATKKGKSQPKTSKAGKPKVSFIRGPLAKTFQRKPASESRRGDALEQRFAKPLSEAGFYGFTVEHVFPIGVDPDMHSYNYIVVGMSKGRDKGKPGMFGDYATWYGIDWTHHPNPSDRARGCVIGEGHYDMTEEEAFRDALDRVNMERRRKFAPVPSDSRSSRGVRR